MASTESVHVVVHSEMAITGRLLITDGLTITMNYSVINHLYFDYSVSFNTEMFSEHLLCVKNLLGSSDIAKNIRGKTFCPGKDTSQCLEIHLKII